MAMKPQWKQNGAHGIVISLCVCVLWKVNYSFDLSEDFNELRRRVIFLVSSGGRGVLMRYTNSHCHSFSGSHCKLCEWQWRLSVGQGFERPDDVCVCVKMKKLWCSGGLMIILHFQKKENTLQQTHTANPFSHSHQWCAGSSSSKISWETETSHHTHKHTTHKKAL